mmetsp:Transcript_14257/g.26942  ORF Transcript_14257/g.26942 Transcript_14257/m.26942 type:complete len:124 (-) Transcript_14257:91-462(-)
MISFLLAERNRLLRLSAASSRQVLTLNRAAQDEMKQWGSLIDRFAKELDSFKLACKYCGLPLSRESVNTFCRFNKGYSTTTNPKAREYGAEGSNLHHFEPIGPQKPKRVMQPSRGGQPAIDRA